MINSKKIALYLSIPLVLVITELMAIFISSFFNSIFIRIDGNSSKILRTILISIVFSGIGLTYVQWIYLKRLRKHFSHWKLALGNLVCLLIYYLFIFGALSITVTVLRLPHISGSVEYHAIITLVDEYPDAQIVLAGFVYGAIMGLMLGGLMIVFLNLLNRNSYLRDKNVTAFYLGGFSSGSAMSSLLINSTPSIFFGHRTLATILSLVLFAAVLSLFTFRHVPSDS